MKIEFNRNSGSKSYEIISSYTVDAEDLPQALQLLKQEVMDNPNKVKVDIVNNNLYAKWNVGNKEYFDYYFVRRV